jgi:hypothetical protein
MVMAVDGKLGERVAKKLKEGWIHSSMMIEVLAGSEAAATKGLQQHVEKMEKEDKSIIFGKDFSPVTKVDKPLPSLEVGYSHIVELEMLTENFEKLFYIVMRYGPSSVEVHKPESIRLPFGEAQGILNSLAEMIHRYAAAGIGGMIINTERI